MKLIWPSFYSKFKCIAGDCPDSCCHEWEVQVDEQSAARYRAMEGPLGEDLRKYLYDEDGETYLQNVNDRCPMWRDDGLCRIQAELDHEALCQTCRDFPRLHHDYGDFVELGLEMSCPEAARIMLTAEDWSLVTGSADGGEEPDYDPELMDLLRQTRPEALGILDREEYSIPERLALLLMYGYHIQARIDGGAEAPFDPAAALAEARQFAEAGDTAVLIEFFGSLEILTDRWRETLEQGAGEPEWFDELCKLARYGILRYYFQAVSDYDLVCRMKLIVVGCIMAAILAKPGFSGKIQMIQLYSKEIENDAENVEAILDGAYTAPGMTDANLLGILL